MKGVHGRAASQLAAILLLLATASTAEEGGTGAAREKCVPARIDGAPVELRTSRGNGFTIDACGRRHWDKGRTHRVAPGARPRSRPRSIGSPPATNYDLRTGRRRSPADGERDCLHAERRRVLAKRRRNLSIYFTEAWIASRSPATTIRVRPPDPAVVRQPLPADRLRFGRSFRRGHAGRRRTAGPGGHDRVHDRGSPGKRASSRRTRSLPIQRTSTPTAPSLDRWFPLS